MKHRIFFFLLVSLSFNVSFGNDLNPPELRSMDLVCYPYHSEGFLFTGDLDVNLVLVSDSVFDYQIIYTLDGSTPDISTGMVYDDHLGIILSSEMGTITIKAMAYSNGNSISDILISTYVGVSTSVSFKKKYFISNSNANGSSLYILSGRKVVSGAKVRGSGLIISENTCKVSKQLLIK